MLFTLSIEKERLTLEEITRALRDTANRLPYHVAGGARRSRNILFAQTQAIDLGPSERIGTWTIGESDDRPMALNARETSTVLCALRRLQDPLHGNRGCEHRDDGLLEDSDIDELAKRIDNFEVAAKPPVHSPGHEDCPGSDALDVLRYMVKNCTAEGYSPWAVALTMGRACLKTQAGEPPAPRRVVIVLETGLVSDVYATHPVDVAVIELVNDEAADPKELHQVPVGDDTVDAYCTIEEPDIFPDRANQLYEIAAKEE